MGGVFLVVALAMASPLFAGLLAFFIFRKNIGNGSKKRVLSLFCLCVSGIALPTLVFIVEVENSFKLATLTGFWGGIGMAIGAIIWDCLE